MILYFAGAEARIAATEIQSAGATNILESAYYLAYRRTANALGFQRSLMDSGGFTLRRTGGTGNPQAYGEYLAKQNVGIAFNLDTLDLEESIANQKIIEAAAPNTYVLPVYHYADWESVRTRDALNRFAGEYPFISIAGLGARSVTDRARFYSYCFSVVRDRVRVHGLGATVIRHMLDFPFYSVDSTSWQNGARFGNWMTFEDGRIVKHMSLRVLATSRKAPTSANPNVMVHDSRVFTQQAIRAYIQFEAHVTRLWASRGVTWNEFDRRRH